MGLWLVGTLDWELIVCILDQIVALFSVLNLSVPGLETHFGVKSFRPLRQLSRLIVILRGLRVIYLIEMLIELYRLVRL